MAIATFKDLVIDAADSAAAGSFWAAALGLRLESIGEDAVLRGASDRHTVWINTAAEPKIAKQRVHLDVHAASIDALLDLGARVLGTDVQPPGGGWTVMADPDGGEFCAFLRQPGQLPEYRLYEIVVDCANPRVAAHWWAEVLGQPVAGDEEHDWWWLESVPGMPFESWVFVPVPEPKKVKNRIHWDVTVASVGDLVAAGATTLRLPDGQIEWTVCADPEGNEFCAFLEG